MISATPFHILTVGWDPNLVHGLCNRVEARGGVCFSHLVHPRYVPQEWPSQPPQDRLHFFTEDPCQRMPEADIELLASLEQEGIPTIHNMIISDRVVSRVRYDFALSYATFLARRLTHLFGLLRPSAVVASFDALHSGISLAVARRMGIPWFAPNFTSIPPGLAGFCDRMSPAHTVPLGALSAPELRQMSESHLHEFEGGRIHAPAYVMAASGLFDTVAKIPRRLGALRQTLYRARYRQLLQFTDEPGSHSVRAAIRYLWRAASARRALARVPVLTTPPAAPYVFFGLHMQPESSIDVWAPFFSNQFWVIELLSRSVPPTHKLLVKIHKSDVENYTREQLRQMLAFPGVELVAPHAHTHRFIRAADLVISIQGTIGLEAALVGKPVIMLGDSPFTLLPSVSRIGEITDLPLLIRKKLAEASPSRSDVVSGYASYLKPFMAASVNNWTKSRSEKEIDGYVKLFAALGQYVVASLAQSRRANP